MTLPLFITLADDSWQRAHYALIVAAGALSLGRTVTIFAGGRSVHALAKDWSGLKDITSDAELDSRGVPSFRDRSRLTDQRDLHTRCAPHTAPEAQEHSPREPHPVPEHG